MRPGTAVLAKGRQRAEAILDAATATFVEHGYAGFSTRRVAARAGVQPGNLQYYYATKEDIVRALLERYLERATRAVEARMAAAARGTAEDRLNAALDGVLADQESAERCRFFRELWALAAHDPAVAEAMHAFYRRYWQAVVAMLLEVTPELGRPRAERRAALVIAMLEGLSLFRSRNDPRQLPLPNLARELRAVAGKLATDVA